jgi:uncharacterized protein (TIGR02271 family)
MALNTENLAQYRGANMTDRSGDKIGKIEEIYLDDRSGSPEWALVNTGLFGTKSTFVPLRDANTSGDDLTVPYEKAKVKDAPKMDADGHLSEQEERELYRYYGMDYEAGYDDVSYDTSQTGVAGVGTDYAERGTGTVADDTSGTETDRAMTLSEEQVNIGTQRRETGRVRLRKYVTTENVTQTVPVSREEVRIEREPITEANRDAAMSGPDLSEEEAEVTLTEEVPVVDKEVTPRERVRLDKDVVTEQQQVSEEVRREDIDLDEGTGRSGLNRDA